MSDGDQKAIIAYISADAHMLPEVLELCESAGYDISGEISQRREGPDPRYYLGPGKIREIDAGDGVEFLVIPSDLTPAQTFYMTRESGLFVVDRIRLILEVFKKRAFSQEAKLQVELADLRHQLPIVREYVHNGKLSERPGFMAGGEYKVDYYYVMIRKRMARLRKELRALRDRRKRTRYLRRRRGSHLVAIAGYTNAGKSTLLNDLMDKGPSGGMVEVGSRVFTTLSPRTRRMRGGRDVLITDTVGFIRDLPPWLVEGFMSTLEEVFTADIVLLVVDASDRAGEMGRKTLDSLDILLGGGTTGKVLIAANKIDLMEKDPESPAGKLLEDLPEEIKGMVEGILPVSAMNGTGMEDLIEAVHDLLPPLAQVEIELPYTSEAEKLRSEIRRRGGDISFSENDDGVVITLLMEERWALSLRRRVEDIGGRVNIAGSR